MNESMQHLLREGADTVARPHLDVDHLVGQAERRMFRRRLGTVAASTVAVVAIVVGAAAMTPDDRRSAPPPVLPVETPETPDPSEPPPAPVAGSATYFAAPPDKSGEPLALPYYVPGQADIYLRRDGEPSRRIVSSRAHEWCPAVSPDGGRMVYLTGRYSGSGDVLPPSKVVVVALDSSGLPVKGTRKVLLRGSLEYCPQWSPDGRSLAVVADGRDYRTPELRVVRLSGTGRLLAVLPPYVASFAWSPDGDQVAYITEDSVWIAPVRRGEPRRFWRSTPTPDRRLQGIPLPESPITVWWLRTGRIAVLVRGDHVSDGWPYVPEGPNVLHVFDVGSRRHHVKVELRGDYPQPALSPDGSKVAAVVGDGRRIDVADLATGSTVRLRPKLDGRRLTINGVGWSADSERVLTDAQLGSDSEGGPYARVAIAPDGSSVEVLTPWKTGSFAW